MASWTQTIQLSCYRRAAHFPSAHMTASLVLVMSRGPVKALNIVTFARAADLLSHGHSLYREPVMVS